MAWSKNNISHRYLWIFSRALHPDFAMQGEHPVTFEEGGEWLNVFIIDAPAGASMAMVQAKAGIFASKFNAWICIEKEAVYENGFSKSSAVEKLAQAMSVPSSKLNSVGDVIDSIYLCKGEVVR